MAREPLILGPGKNDLTVAADQLTVLVENAEPNEELQESFAEQFSPEDSLTDGPWDTGITVNGSPWGWCMPYPGETRLLLVPMEIFDGSRLVLETTSWQTQSMTGAYFRSGLAYFDPVAIGFLQPDESEPEEGFLEVTYRGELNSLASGILSSTWTEFLHLELCPGDMQGWDISIDVKPPLDAEALVPEGLSMLFGACREPMEAWAIMMSDRWWSFTDGEWSVTDTPENA